MTKNKIFSFTNSLFNSKIYNEKIYHHLFIQNSWDFLHYFSTLIKDFFSCRLQYLIPVNFKYIRGCVLKPEAMAVAYQNKKSFYYFCSTVDECWLCTELLMIFEIF